MDKYFKMQALLSHSRLLTAAWVFFVFWNWDCSLDYLIVPVKVLQSLKESKADLEDKYAFARRLSPPSAQSATFTEEEVRQ